MHGNVEGENFFVNLVVLLEILGRASKTIALQCNLAKRSPMGQSQWLHVYAIERWLLEKKRVSSRMMFCHSEVELGGCKCK